MSSTPNVNTPNPNEAASPQLQDVQRSLLSRIHKFDLWIFRRINRMPHPQWLNKLMRIVAIVMNRGDGWLVGLLLSALADTGRSSAKKLRVLQRVALPLWLSIITVEFGLKSIFRRPRPFMALGSSVLIGKKPKRHSFPSGHAAAAFAGAQLLSRHYPRWRPLFYGVALVVGFCRVYLGAHYPSDVVAGAVSGTGLAMVYRRLLRRPTDVAPQKQ